MRVTLCDIDLTQISPCKGIVWAAGTSDRVSIAVSKRGMRTDSSKYAADWPMTHEKRQRVRFKIDCPVTVVTPGRGRKRMLGRGWLYDISEKGARFFLDHILEEGRRVSLEVDFRNQQGRVTTIRFPSIIRRIAPGDLHEIAVRFLKGESYIRGRDSQGRSQDSPWDRFAKGNNWIN